MFIPYKLDEPINSKHNKLANIIIYDCDKDINYKNIKQVIDDVTTEITQLLSINILSLHAIIFNNNTIMNYCLDLVNSISNKYEYGYINTNIKEFLGYKKLDAY